jgi:hypothetical protein
MTNLAINGKAIKVPLPTEVAKLWHSIFQMKFFTTLLTVVLVASGLLTGCQSPTDIAPSKSVGLPSARINSGTTNRILMIDPSSMPVGGGKATLTISPLQRADGVFTGDYQIRVFPYVFENENGRLAIVVSDASLAGIKQGKVVKIIGTATTIGKGGKSRHIDATATPLDNDRGTLKLWFMAGNRKMIFEPGYHLAENGAVVLAQTP